MYGWSLAGKRGEVWKCLGRGVRCGGVRWVHSHVETERSFSWKWGAHGEFHFGRPEECLCKGVWQKPSSKPPSHFHLALPESFPYWTSSKRCLWNPCPALDLLIVETLIAALKCPRIICLCFSLRTAFISSLYLQWVHHKSSYVPHNQSPQIHDLLYD